MRLNGRVDAKNDDVIRLQNIGYNSSEKEINTWAAQKNQTVATRYGV